MQSNETRRAANDRLTGRERRRRIVWLSLLLIALLIAGGLTFYFVQNRSVPNLALLPDAQAVVPPRYLYSITGEGPNVLSAPTGVAVAPNGDVYVVDFDKSRIGVYDRGGDFKFSFNKLSDGKATKLRTPVNVAIAGDEVWVTDRRLRGIYVFNLAGEYQRKFVPKNLKGEWTPLALDVTETGEVRVTDVGGTEAHRIVLLDKTGDTEKAVGKTGQVSSPDDQTGSFYFPSGIAVSEDGRVFVADGDNRRIQVFDKSGTFKYVVNTGGVPRGVAIDDKNRLYVVDALAHLVTVYNLDGEEQTQFGSQGFGPGQFNFPNDIAVGPDKRLYVTDRQNNQVQVWEWPAAAVAPPLAEAGRTLWPLVLPLFLLPLLFLRKKRRYVLTPDFVDALEAAGAIDLLTAKRSRFVAPEADAKHYKDRVIGDVNLNDVIHLEAYSASDVAVVKDRFEIDESDAIYLTMADRAKALLTDDTKLTDLAIIAEIRVIDSREFRAASKAKAQTA